MYAALALGLLTVLFGVVGGIVALFNTFALQRRVRELERRLAERGAPPASAPDAVSVPAPTPAPAPAPAPIPSPGDAAPVPPGPPTPAARSGRERAGWLDDLEAHVGKRWTTWLGALALVVAAGLFVQYAFENRWIGPVARVVLSLLAGVVLLAGGDRAVRRGMRALGMGLTGAGLAVLYAGLFAAYALYDLVPQGAAFAAMALVTVAGGALAVRHDALPTSVLALLGGLLVPLLLSTGRDARDGLFAYLALLDAGVLLVALFRRWRALDVLAFAGTWAWYAGWFDTFYTPAALVPALLWAAVFYTLFLVLPFAWHLRHGVPATVERFVLALANGAAAFGAAWSILAPAHQHVLGAVALGMGAASLALGAAVRRRAPGDARTLLGFVALALVFVTIAVPLHVGLYGNVLVWAAEAVALAWLGWRFRYLPVRLGALAVLATAGVRLFTMGDVLADVVLRPFANAWFGSALFLAAAGGAVALLQRRGRAMAPGPDAWVGLAAGAGAGLLALTAVHAEYTDWWAQTVRGEALGTRWPLVLLWSAGAAAFLATGAWLRSLGGRLAGLLPLAVALTLAAETYAYTGPGDALFLDPRFGAALLAVGGLFVACRLLRAERRAALPLAALALLGLPLLLSGEVWEFFLRPGSDPERGTWTALMGLTVTWAAYAIALLVSGFRVRVRALRLTGLGVFGVTAAKLLFVDLAHIEQLARILSFVGTGLLLVGASWLYHRAEQRLAADAPPPSPDAAPGREGDARRR